MTTYARITLVQDDSAFIQTRLILDPYRPREIVVMEERTITETVTEKMTALEARESGLDVDPNIPDEKIILAEWTEDITEQIPAKETRLRYRRKSPRSVSRRNRCQDIRPEIAGAAINPYKLIQHQKLIEMVNEEIDYWMNHNISKKIRLTPLILILLSAKEQPDGSHAIGTRRTFLIKKYTEWHIQAEDHQGTLYEIDLDKGVVESGIIRRFTLFLPINAGFRVIQPGTNSTNGNGTSSSANGTKNATETKGGPKGRSKPKPDGHLLVQLPSKASEELTDQDGETN